MTRSAEVHGSLSLDFRGVLVDDEEIVGHDGAYLIFLLFSANAEDLVVDLDGDKVFGQDVWIAQVDWGCCLR